MDAGTVTPMGDSEILPRTTHLVSISMTDDEISTATTAFGNFGVDLIDYGNRMIVNFARTRMCAAAIYPLRTPNPSPQTGTRAIPQMVEIEKMLRVGEIIFFAKIIRNDALIYIVPIGDYALPSMAEPELNDVIIADHLMTSYVETILIEPRVISRVLMNISLMDMKPSLAQTAIDSEVTRRGMQVMNQLAAATENKLPGIPLTMSNVDATYEDLRQMIDGDSSQKNCLFQSLETLTKDIRDKEEHLFQLSIKGEEDDDLHRSQLQFRHTSRTAMSRERQFTVEREELLSQRKSNLDGIYPRSIMQLRYDLNTDKLLRDHLIKTNNQLESDIQDLVDKQSILLEKLALESRKTASISYKVKKSNVTS